MFFSKFNRVNICALLLLIHLIASSASKIWHPRGLSTMTRIGRSEDSGSDPSLIRLASKRWNPQGLGRITRVGKRNENFDSEPSFIHSDDKRIKMTNFIRTGRSVESCKVDGVEPWYRNGIDTTDLKTNKLSKDLYTILNQDYPANELFGYNDQEDTLGFNGYYDNM